MPECVSSGLAQADIVAQAVAGEGPFKKTAAPANLRVIADLYGEDLHLIAAKNAKIKSVADLRGKRVGLSTEGSGTLITARAVLAAFRVPEKSLAANYDGADRAIALLQQGKLDALFFVGGTPVGLIEQLLDEDVGRADPHRWLGARAPAGGATLSQRPCHSDGNLWRRRRQSTRCR